MGSENVEKKRKQQQQAERETAVELKDVKRKVTRQMWRIFFFFRPLCVNKRLGENMEQIGV